MKTYLLNSPVLTGYGQWRFEGPIDVAQARQSVANGFVSAIGHQSTAELLSQLLGVEVPVNRVKVEMQPGDRALIMRLTERPPEGKVLTVEEMKQLGFELGVLERVA